MPGSTEPTTRGIDALLPAEIVQKAETVGFQKTRLDILSLLALAVLAGAFIALGAMFATTVPAGADGVLPFGLSRLLAGVAFCLGLILVVLGGAELFTGNTLMVMAWAAGKVRLHEMLRAWLVVYVGNFIGATGTALLVFLSGQYLSGRGVVASVVLKLALDKVTLPFDHALFLGILCNVLVVPCHVAHLRRSNNERQGACRTLPSVCLCRGWFRAFSRQHVSHSSGFVCKSVGPS